MTKMAYQTGALGPQSTFPGREEHSLASAFQVAGYGQPIRTSYAA
jgi:hypothetical protein